MKQSHPSKHGNLHSVQPTLTLPEGPNRQNTSGSRSPDKKKEISRTLRSINEPIISSQLILLQLPSPYQRLSFFTNYGSFSDPINSWKQRSTSPECSTVVLQTLLSRDPKNKLHPRQNPEHKDKQWRFPKGTTTPNISSEQTIIFTVPKLKNNVDKFPAK